jgi:hypothetical protein
MYQNVHNTKESIFEIFKGESTMKTYISRRDEAATQQAR